MKRAALAAVALLVLTGCAAGTTPDEPEATQRIETSAEAISPAPAEVTPEAAATPVTQAERETAFVEAAQRWNLGLTDAEILGAAAYACEQLATGNISVVALEGASYAVNGQFVSSAQVYFCPETQPE